MTESARNESVDARVLPVRGDVLLHVSPHMIHRVEMRRPRRQPEQGDTQLRRQTLRGLRRVAGVSIEKQGDVTPAIPAAHLAQERTEVRGPLVLAAEQHEVAGAKVHRAEEHAFGVAPSEPDLGLFATRCPPSTQGWEEQQVGFVLGQDDAAFR